MSCKNLPSVFFGLIRFLSSAGAGLKYPPLMFHFLLFISLLAAAEVSALKAQDYFRLRIPALPHPDETRGLEFNSHQTHDAMLYMVESFYLNLSNPLLKSLKTITHK